MAKGANEDSAGATVQGLSTFESRLTNLLALHLVKEKKQPEQVSLLSRVGFLPKEIAVLLDTTPNTVSVVLYQKKKKKSPKRPSKTKG